MKNQIIEYAMKRKNEIYYNITYYILHITLSLIMNYKLIVFTGFIYIDY